MKTTSDAKKLLDKLTERVRNKRGQYRYKLTAEQVREARQVWDLASADTGYGRHGLVSELARHYKVSFNVMDAILRRVSYRWVKG